MHNTFRDHTNSCCGGASGHLYLQGIILNEEGEGVAEAWKEKAPHTPTLAEKTKKNVMLEASLFSIVCLSFVFFNIYYWTRERDY